MMYVKYPLSLRDVEDLLFDRGNRHLRSLPVRAALARGDVRGERRRRWSCRGQASDRGGDARAGGDSRRPLRKLPDIGVQQAERP